MNRQYEEIVSAVIGTGLSAIEPVKAEAARYRAALEAIYRYVQDEMEEPGFTVADYAHRALHPEEGTE